MKRRVTSFLMALLMVLTLLPAMAVTAHAATSSGKCGDSVNWTLSGSTLTISGTGKMWDYTGDEEPGWFSQRSSIEKIVVKSGVTSIGVYAFIDCGNVTSVSLPASLTYIQSYAFALCTKLKSITIPAGIEDIGIMAFVNCTGLTTVKVADSNTVFATDGRSLLNKDKTVLYAYLAQAYQLYTIPSTVKTISYFAFSNCTELRSVTIPTSVTSIQDYAFADCTSLKSMTVPASVTHIGTLAFGDCTAMTSFKVAGGNTTYASDGRALFYKSMATLLEYCTLGNTNYYTVPSSVAAIHDYAFAFCSQLQGVVVQSKVHDVGPCAFANCTGMGFVTFLGNQPDIASDAFYNTSVRVYYPMNNSTWNDFDDFGGDPLYEARKPFRITAQPQSVSLAAGSTAVFTVKATGSELRYDWFVKKSGEDMWRFVSSGINPTLTVTVDKSTIGNQYRCVVSDICPVQITSAAATLTLGDTLEILSQPQDVDAALNEKVTFSTAVAGENLSYQWQIKTPHGDWQKSTAASGKTDTLQVTASAARNGYKYRCVVTDANGDSVTTDEARLTVVPVITAQPQNISTTAGTAVQYTVQATGIDLQYRWHIKTPGSTVWKNSTSSSATTDTLNVTATAGRNGYEYRCMVMDSSGIVVYTDVVSLSVDGGAAITAQPQSVTAPLGETAVFQVAAVGEGLTYQWQIKTPASGEWVNSTAAAGKTDRLTAPVTAGRNGYEYRCVITDANGKKLYSETAGLQVETVVTDQPQNVTAAAGSTVKFTVKASGAGLKYRWQILTPGATEWVDSSASSAKTAALSVAVTAGKNGYRYRCVITDANGLVITTDAARLTVG